MTETPRTDHHYKDHPGDMHDHVTLEFARGLEREVEDWKSRANSLHLLNLEISKEIRTLRAVIQICRPPK